MKSSDMAGIQGCVSLCVRVSYVSLGPVGCPSQNGHVFITGQAVDISI